MAETRSTARALRFAGYGVEFTGLEEVLHVQDTVNKEAESASSEGNGNGKLNSFEFLPIALYRVYG
ncbi:hypothetical protein ACFL2Q_10545 [Thermodesulfobacteriota bacterium]